MHTTPTTGPDTTPTGDSQRERVIDALYDVRWPDGEPKLRMARKWVGELADAAIAAMDAQDGAA